MKNTLKLHIPAKPFELYIISYRAASTLVFAQNIFRRCLLVHSKKKREALVFISFSPVAHPSSSILHILYPKPTRAQSTQRHPAASSNNTFKFGAPTNKTNIARRPSKEQSRAYGRPQPRARIPQFCKCARIAHKMYLPRHHHKNKIHEWPGGRTDMARIYRKEANDGWRWRMGSCVADGLERKKRKDRPRIAYTYIRNDGAKRSACWQQSRKASPQTARRVRGVRGAERVCIYLSKR